MEIWNMCTLTNQDQKFDKIVLNALRYFKNLVMWPDLHKFFEDNIERLIKDLIIPNIGISQRDTTMFIEEPSLFIESYFDASEINTRRSVSIDLLRSLVKFY